MTASSLLPTPRRAEWVVAVGLVAILLAAGTIVSINGSTKSAGQTQLAGASGSQGTISPTAPNIDQGQSVLLTATPIGGTGPYIFTWFNGTGNGNCSGSTVGGTMATFDAGPLSTSGSPYFYCFEWLDSTDTTGNSSWATVTVNPAPVAGPPSPQGQVLDLGQPLTLASTASGGTSTLNYQWYDQTSGVGACSGGTELQTGPDQVVTSLVSVPGTYFCYVVTDSSSGDSGPQSAASSWDLVAVNPALTAPNAPTVSSTAIDSNQSLTVQGTIPSDGTPPYAWQWLIASNGGAYAPSSVCSVKSGAGAVAGATETCTISAGSLSGNTNYTFELRVTDGASSPETEPSTPSNVVTVSPTLTAGGITPPSPTIDDGQTVTLHSAAAGGSGSDSYQWYSGSSKSGCTSLGNPISGATSTTYGASPSTGTYYCYVVTDSVSSAATSGADLVSVNPALTAPGAPSPSATTVDASQAVSVTGTMPSTGTPPYAWQWLVSVSGGSYRDATECGSSASGSGAGPGTTKTCSIPANSLAANSNYDFRLEITDNSFGGASATSAPSTLVSVNPALSAGSGSPTAPSIDSGQSVTLTATPSGGSTPYDYQWYSSSKNTGSCNSGTALGASKTQPVSPSTTTYYCYVVTDSASATGSSNWNKVTVNAKLAAGAASPTGADLDLGQAVTLTATPSGGTTPYDYRWHWSTSAAGSCSSGTSLGSASTQTTGSEISAAGSYYYCYVVTDNSQADGGPATASSNWDLVSVNSSLSNPGTPIPNGTSLDVNQPLKVTATVPSTGTAPYSWQWLSATSGHGYSNAAMCSTASGAGASAGSTESCSVVAGGLAAGDVYTFELKVTDGADSPQSKTSSASTPVTVSSALTAPSAPTPNATALDADQALTVSDALPSTGSSPYSWQWLISVGTAGSYSDATQCGSTASGSGASAGAMEKCMIPGNTLTASTTYHFELQVTDNASTPESKTSVASSAVTTSSVLTAGSPSPSSPTLDSGQSVSLMANPSGGTSPYTFQWYSGSTAADCTALGSPISGATAASYVAAPSSSTFYCYEVTDARSATSISLASEVAVNAGLTAPGAPALSGTAVDSDQLVAVTATLPSSGTPSYSWTWLVSVNGGPFVTAAECSANSGTGAAASSTESCSIPSGGLTVGDEYAFELNVTDSATTPETSTSSASAALTVASALTAPAAPTPSRSTVSGSETLSVNGTLPSSGTSPYSWQWLVSVDGGAFVDATICATNSGSGASAGGTEDCQISGGALTSGDTYAFELAVTDSASSAESRASSASATVTAIAVLSAGSPNPPNPAIDAGQSVTLSSNATGGSGGLTYQWYSASTASGCQSLGSPIPGATSVNYTASPTGTTFYCYVVTDSHSDSVTSTTVELVVNPALTAPAAPTPSATTLSANQGVTLAGKVPSTGTPTFSWQWLVSINGGAFVDATQCSVNSGLGALAGAPETCAIAAGALIPGDSYAFELRVTDSSATPNTTTSAATPTLTVAKAGGGSGGSSAFPWLYVGIGAGAAAVLLLLFVGFRSRLRRPSTRRSGAVPDWQEPSTPTVPGGASRAGPAPIELPPSVVPPVPVPRPPSPQSGSGPIAPGTPAGPDANSEIDKIMAELDRISSEILKRPSKIDPEASSDAGQTGAAGSGSNPS
jgi:hypothetical protein